MLLLCVHSPMTAWWQEKGRVGSKQPPPGGLEEVLQDGPTETLALS